MKTRSSVGFLTCIGLSAALLLSSAGCKNSQKNKNKNPFSQRSTTEFSNYDDYKVDVNLTVGNGKKAVLTAKNNNSDTVTWGEGYILEYQYDGDWYTVPFGEKGGVFLHMGYILYSGTTKEKVFYLDDQFDNLPSGHYRMVETMNQGTMETGIKTYTLANEFDL